MKSPAEKNPLRDTLPVAKAHGDKEWQDAVAAARAKGRDSVKNAHALAAEAAFEFARAAAMKDFEWIREPKDGQGGLRRWKIKPCVFRGSLESTKLVGCCGGQRQEEFYPCSLTKGIVEAMTCLTCVQREDGASGASSSATSGRSTGAVAATPAAVPEVSSREQLALMIGQAAREAQNSLAGRAAGSEARDGTEPNRQAALDALVSVVIPSRQEGEWTRKTVQSAIDSADGPLEVVVVDDASTDASCDGLEALGGPDRTVRVVRLATSAGAGAARNIGAAAARGRVVVFCDAHMQFPSGIFHAGAAFALSHGAIVCPTVASMGGGAQGQGGTLCYHRDGKIGLNYHQQTGSEPERITGVIGACYIMPRDVMDRLARYPSTAAGWGYEEEALAAWAWLNEVPIYSFPSHTTRHLYRSEINTGKVKVPWGGPSTSGLWLNIAANHLALFGRKTYQNVWRAPALPYLDAADKATLASLEAGRLWVSDSSRPGAKRSDAEFFRDVLQVPAVSDASGQIERVLSVSVIISARNEGDEVLSTLVSIINSGQMRFEIVLVDDASEDGSVPADLVDKVKARVADHWRDGLEKRIKIIRHEKPAGCSRSRIEAMKAASGDVFVVMDAHERMMTSLGVEILATQATALGGIIVPSYCNLGMSTKTDRRTYSAKCSCQPKWGLYCDHVTEKPSQRVVRRNSMIGACYAVTRETLDRLGGWPSLPGFWAYDEQWLGVRCWFLGVPTFCDSGVCIEHKNKEKFNYSLTHLGVLENAHLTHYIHFGDEAYQGYFRPALLLHGFDPKLDALLASPDVQRQRAEFEAQKKAAGRTDRRFFAEVLGLTEWPPVWKEVAK